jgi:AmmeMemoRadiSam system protein A
MDYSLDDKRILLSYARNSIKCYLEDSILFEPKNVLDKFIEKRGVFVSLKKNGYLRGCIGYILPIKPLYLSVCENAYNAAFRDNRFYPVTLDELNEIKIEISVLSVPSDLNFKDFDELNSKIVIGRDGVILEKSNYSSVFLPQVPVEQNWDVLEYIENLCLKAGLDRDSWSDKDTKLFLFQADVFDESLL